MVVPSSASALHPEVRPDRGKLAGDSRSVTPIVAVLLVLLVVASSLLFLAQGPSDPLAKFRAPDGSLRIPGGALTPELQRLIFGGNDLQPFLNLSYYAPARSPYPTMTLVEVPYHEINPNVFVHRGQQPESLASSIARLVARWFPPFDWGAQARAAVAWFSGFLVMDARAVVSIDSTTVADVTGGGGANTCTTSQSAAAIDNAVLVMLSEAGTTTFLSVTYGSVSLTLITGASGNGGTAVRTEVWGFAGILPGGLQTMTATLSGGVSAKMTCATVLLQGVQPTGGFSNGRTNTATTTNATITLAAAVGSSNLAFAVAALQQVSPGGAQPTAVTGTGATATDLYGVATVHCTGNPATNECAAGADIPSAGTAITWTNPSTTWVVSAVEVVAGGCGTNGVICTSVTVTNVTNAANACTTSQTAVAADNAVLVMLSEAGTTAFLTVTYGSVSLNLIAGTNGNGGTAVRTETWGFVGTLPAGAQTMTATLSGGVNAKMTCATVLLQGVQPGGGFINGRTNTATSTNATITLAAPVGAGSLAFAVTALQQVNPGGAQPTAVTGTGATALDLYGVSIIYCTGNPTTNECAAGANIPTGGTAITWTNPSTTWVVSAVEVVSAACGSGGSNCYRIGTGGTWTSTTNWSRTSGGPTCNCTPAATDAAIFNASPTGTVTLAAATTIGSIDMTGFTGTLDTTASNFALTVNGSFTIQGALQARGSTITVAGNVTVIGATTPLTMGTSVWTVRGTWANYSTSGAWSAGTSSVTIVDAASGSLTFGNLGGNEFNNLTVDASVAAGVTYTMATNGLRVGGSLVIRNSTAGATGPTILDTSVSNLGITAGSMTLGALGAANTQASTVTVNGNVTVSAASGYLVNTGGSWVVTGAWSDASTSASWAFAAAMLFRSAVNQTMTFGPQAGNEFAGAVTFDTTVTAAVTYTMATNPLDAGGLLTIQNSAAGATGTVTLDTSAGSLAVNVAGLTLSTLGAFNTRASTISVSGSVTIGAGNAYVTNIGGAWSVSGAWTDRTTSGSWSFAGAMTFRAAASQSMIFTGSNIAGNEFGGAVTLDTTTPTGITYTMAAGATGDSSFRAGGALIIRNSAGGATAATILDTSVGNFGVTAAALTLGTPRGALRSQGSAVTINGAATVSDANSYIVFGTGAWVIAGAWTNSSTDSVDWSAGTGTLTFRSAANATMTFANLGANEANNVIFDTSAAAGVTYAMATNGLRIAGTLTVQNTAATPTGNVVLTTSASNLAITAGQVVLGSRGTLTGNGSTITVNGSWTSTAANHVWNRGTSTVIFGATGTLTTSAGDSFNNLTQSTGTTTLGSAVTVAGIATVTGTLDTSASNFALTLQSTLSVTATGVLNLEASAASTAGNVTIAAGGAVRFAGAGTWTINGSWTDNNTAVPGSWAISTATVRFVGSAATTLTFWTAPVANEFYNLVLDSSVAAGLTYTQVNALQAAGTLTLQNTAAGATGAVVWDASALSYPSTVGGLSVAALGAFASRAASVTVNGNVSISGSGYVASTAGGAWSITGSWTNNTVSASWSFLASIAFRSAANQTMTFKPSATEFGGSVTFDTTNGAGVTYTLATNALTVSGLLTVLNSVASPTGNTVLDTSISNLGVTAGSVALGTNGTLVAEGSTINVGGNWTVTAANATFTAGTSTVVFSALTTVNMTQPFYNLVITGGTTSLASALTVTATLTVSGGILAKGTSGMTLATLALSGGAVTSTSGNVAVSGNVGISSPSSYIAFGSETWTIGGSWTNASTSASWSVGTAAVVFSSSSSQTMTFMAGAASEFYNVTFNSGASTVTFTMAVNILRVANVLTVQGGTGTTALSTSAANLSITAVSLTVAAGGTLAANGSTIAVRSMDTSTGTFVPATSTVVVNASGGTLNVTQTVNNLTVNSGISTSFTGNLTFSGTLTLTSSTPTFTGNLTSSGAAAVTFASATVSVGGSWDTSSAASFTSTASTVTFTGASKTVRLAGTQSFASLSVSGTLTQVSQLTATSLAVSAGSLTKGTNPLTVNGNLTLSGGALVSTSGAVTVTGNVNVSTAASFIQFGSEAWTINGSWTDASTSTSWAAGTGTVTFGSGSSQTMTFAGANLSGPEFNNLVFDTTAAAGVTYSMATRGLSIAGNLTIQNTTPTPTGNTILTTSAANLPITSTGTIATASTGTLTANASTITFASFNTSAGTFNPGTSTLVAGTSGGTINAPQNLNNLSVNASVTLSAASNLTIAGTLAVTGVFATLTFNLTAASLAPLAGGITAGASGAKTITGNVTVTATGFFSFGAAPWTFAGAWTNNSTSASWSPGTATVTFSSATGGTMTFAGSNLAGVEFSTVVFASTAATAQTFTMASRGLNAGTVQVNDATSTTNLDTSAANLPIAAPTVTVGSGGILTARGSTITVTSIDTSAGTFTSGTSTVVVSASPGSVNVPQTLSNLTVNPGITATFASNITWSGILTLTSSTSTFNGNLTSSGAATATFGSASISISGSWDTSSATSMTGTSSTVTFTGTTRTVRLAAGHSFGAVAITGTLSQLSQLTSTSLTIGTGSLTKGTNTLTVNGNLTLSGGALISTSGNVLVSGNVSVSSAASYIAFGSEAWSVSGSWANASTSASWSAGTATVTFNASSAQTMTFAGANLSANEFNAVAFNSGASAVTFTMSTRGLSAGSVTVQGGTAVTTLTTSNLPVATGTFTVAANGSLVAGSSTLSVQSINTATGSFAPGTSTIVVTSSSGTANVTQTLYNLTVNAGITTTVASALTFSGTVTLTSAVVAFTSDLTSSGVSAVLTFGSAALTVAGSWNTASIPAASLTATGSSVTFSGAAKTIALSAGSSLASATITGTLTQSTPLTANTLVISSGGLTKATNALTVNGSLTLSGGYLASTSGAVTVSGNVTISAAASYISFGSETWTVNGSWTNSSTSASWAAGTGTVIFAPAGSGTYTFGNLPGNEFNNVQLSPGAAATFTMATNGLRWGGSLTLNSNATLATAGLTLNGGSLIVANGATLTANASSVSAVDVSMVGGTSGTITLTTGAWTVSGNWDTSGLGSTFTAGSSSVTFTGLAKTVKLLIGQQFANLAISGTTSQASDLKATAVTVTGTLTKSGFNLILNGLTATAGTIVDGAVSVTNLTVADNDPTAYITFSVFSAWTANTQYAWTHTDTKTTDTITFTISGQTGVVYNVYKNGVLFKNGSIVGGNITFTMLGSDPNVVVTPSGCTGNSRYWILGTGNWSQTSHWSSTSGGVGGCSLPGNATDVFFDANSGTGTVTVDMNDNFATLTTTGSTIATIAIGTNSLTTSGNVTHAAGTITIGASLTTGLAVGGTLTLSGTAVLDGSGSASVVTVTGGVTISSATAYIRMGSGTWTVSGAWSNASTSASWAAGMGTVVFNAAISQTMTFAGTNLPGAEFNNVTFNSGAATTTFTLATRGVNVAGLLTLQGGTGVTTLDLSAANLPLTLGSVTVGANGVLNGRGSAIAVSGNWDSHLGTFTAGTSTVTLSGAAKTVNTASAFAGLTVSGSYTMASAVTAGATSISGSLNSSTSNFALAVGDLTVSGSLTANASAITVSGNWDSHLGTFTAGTSTVTMSGAAKTVNTASAFAGLTVSGSYTMASGISAGATVVSGTLTTTATNYALTAGDITITGTLVANGSAITVSGNWDSHLGTFTAGTSTVTLSGAAKTVNTASAFASLNVSGSYTMASAMTAATTSISGSLSTSATNYALTVGDLSVTGTLTANGSAITVSGNWDSHLGTFAAGTSTVTLSGAAKTVNTASAFATLHVTGTVTAASAVTVGTALTIDTSGSFDVSATNFALNAASLTVGTTGTLIGRGSTITVTSMDTHLGTFTVGTSTVVIGGSSGTINITQTLNNFTVNASVTTTVSSNLTWSGALILNNGDVVTIAGNLTSSGTLATLTLNGAAVTVSGNWDTSSTGGSFTAGTSAVTLNGVGRTYTTATGQTLNVVTVGGTITLASDLRTTSLVVTGTLTKTSFNLTFNGLTDSTGAIVDGTVSASNFTVSNSEPAAFTTISVFSVWSANVQYGWTHTSSSTTTTITFTITSITGTVYNVTKNGALFTSGGVVGGQIQFTMLGSDPVILVNLSGCTGTDEYWVLGTGNWNDPTHWATSSGGVGGCGIPQSTTNVHVDANSGTGTITVNVNASIASLATSGSTIGTLAIGTFNFSTSGNVTHAAGTITVGASLATGLAIGGSLTLSGSAVLDGSSGASIVSAAGGATISSATAYFRMGSATWTFGGAWSNASTAASWSSGTGTVVFNAGASATVTFGNVPGNEFNNLTIDSTAPAGVTYTMATNALRVAGVLLVRNSTATPTGNVSLATSNLAVTAGSITIGTNGTINAGSSTFTVSGNWTATATNATFTAGTSTVNLGATATIGMTSAFYNLTVTAGTLTAGSNLAVGNALTIIAGALAKSTFTLSASSLTLSGGALTSTSGNVTITGNVGITAATSYIAFGSETWTVSGSWSNASTSASWTPGTGAVVFNAATAQTMTFAGTNLAGSEFNNVTFNAGAATVTFTLAARGLRTAGTLTVAGGTGVTTLNTGVSSLPLNAVALNVNAGGSIVANGSTLTVTSMDTHLGTFTVGTSTVVVNASGGTTNIPQTLNNLTVSSAVTTTFASAITWSGTLTLTGTTATFASDLASAGAATLAFGSATLSVAGVWNTSSATGFTSTGSSVTLTGAAKSITLAATQGFAALTVSGTYTMSSQVTAAGIVTVRGTLDTSGTNFPLTAGGLLVTGATAVLRSNGSTVAISGNVSIDNAAGYITAAAGGTWTVTNGTWTNGSSSASWSFAAPITFRSNASVTMSFGAVAQEFGGNVTFDSSVAAGVTFTLATNGLRVGGTLTIQNTTPTPTAHTVLSTSASNLPVAAVSLVVAATGTLTANASTITVGSIDTHLGTFNVGTSTVVVNASGGTINVSQIAFNVTVNSGVSTTFAGPLGWSGALTLTGATVDFGANSLTSAGAATMSFGSATITMSSGTWDTSSMTTFTSTGSAVTFSGTGSLALGSSSAFATLTVSGGTRTLLSSLTTQGLLTISGGILAKGTNALTLNAGLTLSGGALTSTSGAVSVTGSVVISSAASYIAFGSEAWTVSGPWTNASTSASWAVGTATVTFTSGSPQTMTFAALPAGAVEFNNVTFNSGAATATFTMATNALAWSGTLTVQGGTGATTLATGGLGLTGGTLSVGNAGSLLASASAVNVTGVAMVGGTSGTITITTGAWTVNGSWNTSGAGSTFAAGTSTVTLGGTGMVSLATGQAFNNLTIAGSMSLASSVTALGTITVGNGAVLTKTGQSLSFNGMTETGTGSVVDGTVTVVNLVITNSDATNVTTVTAFTVWFLDGEFRWTHSSTVGTSTLTFTVGGNTGGNRFSVTKDGLPFTTGIVNASGQVVFTMLGSDPLVDVIIAAPCGVVRYWVGGAGTWSDTARWSATSGGAGGCSVPTPAVSVLFDANSGAGTTTLTQDAAAASITAAGWSGSLSLGTFALTVGGNVALGGGTLTVGASAGAGLTITGNLTLTGSALLDGSGAASVVSVTGSVSIATTAAFRMGSGMWTFGGSWTNASTSASWAAGTGTVVFTSATPQTMTLAGFAGTEFSSLRFASAAATGTTTFTLATNSLRWAGTLSIQDTAGSATVLDTANLLLSGGSLTVGNGGTLRANGSAVTVVDVTVAGGISGTVTVTTGTWTVSGNWNTSGAGSTFTKGTGTVLMTGSNRTLAIATAGSGFYNLTITGTIAQGGAIDVTGTLSVRGTLTTAGRNITGGAVLIISGGGSLVGSTSSIIVGGVTMNDASPNSLSMTSGSITVSGPWDTSGSSSSLTAGTSTVALTGASSTLALGATQSLAALTVSGAYTLMGPLAVSSLTIMTGSLAKGSNALTLSGDLILSGGYLSSVSGDVAIAGSVNIGSPASYIAFGSEAWEVTGGWTNASTSASWSAGTGTITFDATASQTMTFAGTNLPGLEFNSVVFNSGVSTVTFTLAGTGLQARAIAILGGTGTTSLDTSTSNVPMGADTLTVGANGAFLANGSTVTLRSIDTSAGNFVAGGSLLVISSSGGSVRVPQPLHSLTVTAGTTTAILSNLTWNGVLTLTGATASTAAVTSSGAATVHFASAVLTIGGSWDTSSATTFDSTGSTVTFTGAGQTIALGTGQVFATLVIGGTATIASDLSAAILTVSPSSTLTKTGHSIAFNRLNVGGTIADGSVAVSNLTVADSDPAASVTISVFSVWTPGSEYGWTHTVSAGIHTITWTISGNTPGFLYHVAKDGAPFANGAVDGSGAVVFTMAGSDPDMRVTLVAPPVPPWWTSPYFLSALPFPFIVVVAMFVQRRRWKPAKAFLVDERGQLLREFTLDPSCKVTYNEALEAGALDAVEKDVRVARYHARAVHGDALSLVMLAVGPANLEEVEFARGILVNIQDKLEDHVKARVEEARSEEAVLASTHQKTDEELADLHARSRVFGDMVNAFTIARRKLDEDSTRLRGVDADVRERADRLAEDRGILMEREAQLEEDRKSLEVTAAGLRTEREELGELKETLHDREASLVPKEEALEQRATDVSKQESEVAAREEELKAAQAKLASDLEDHQAKAALLEAAQKELAEEHKALDELSVQLDQQQTAFTERVTSVETREKEAASTVTAFNGRLGELEPRERDVAQKETELAKRESSLAERESELGSNEDQVRSRLANLRAQAEALANRSRELSTEREELDQATAKAAEDRRALDEERTRLAAQDTELAKKTQDLADLKGNLEPREATLIEKEDDLKARMKQLATERKNLQRQEELVASKAFELQQQIEQVKEREANLEQEKILFQDAKAAFDAEHRELEDERGRFSKDIQDHEAETAARERNLEEERARLTQDAEAFDAQRAEKNQWIASKEIELEAKEQSLADREKEIRAQAEENARRFTEVATREEEFEIDMDRLDKARVEAESRNAEYEGKVRDLDAKVAKIRDEETRRGEELHTWQSTLESEQALLKEQQETFEKEMQELRESWAGRMIRVEQREEELKQREAKVQTDVEWIGRSEVEIGAREKAAADALEAGNKLKAESERLRAEIEQRALEVESRERTLREEAANQSIELEKRAEALRTSESNLEGLRAQWEREVGAEKLKLKVLEAEVTEREQSFAAKVQELGSQESSLASQKEALDKQAERATRERADLDALEKQIESQQLALRQERERFETESQRARTELDAVRQSVAAKEADLGSERERLERESTSLQDKLGAKARDLANREKTLAASETSLRAGEENLGARTRETESRERQLDARAAEMASKEKALQQRDQELTAQRASFDSNVHKFEAESASRQKEWGERQENLKSQQARLAADAQMRQADIKKQMENLEQKEKALNASLTQAQIERSRLEGQASILLAKEKDLAGAAARADARFAEIKKMEDERLKARQALEIEKAAWANRRQEELKQLEATRDAAAEQTQQSERLIQEAQRRAYVAAEAEKASTRQASELAAAQAELERRRVAAENAERGLQGQMTQFRAASQDLSAKGAALDNRARQLDSFQAHLTEEQRKGAEAAEVMKARKTTLDREAERLAGLAAFQDRQAAELASRAAAVEARLAEVVKREQVVTTELQRADNLMVDLNRKDAELGARHRELAGAETTLSKKAEAQSRREAEVTEGMETLQRLRKEHDALVAQSEEEFRKASQARADAASVSAEAVKLKSQAEAMQTEVAKNMRFLQKKALDILDREEKIRTQETKTEEQGQALESRSQALDKKERSLGSEKERIAADLEKAKAEIEKLKAKIADAEKTEKSTAEMEEWKRDIDNRVKIIQKKALDLLDREEKLRKREAELKALEEQVKATAKS